MQVLLIACIRPPPPMYPYVLETLSGPQTKNPNQVHPTQTHSNNVNTWVTSEAACMTSDL